MPPVVDVLDSVSDADNTNAATDGKNQGCGGVMLDASDDLQFNPGVKFNDE